jgi:hypothetical protein
VFVVEVAAGAKYCAGGPGGRVVGVLLGAVVGVAGAVVTRFVPEVTEETGVRVGPTCGAPRPRRSCDASPPAAR